MKRALPIIILLLAGLYFLNPNRDDFKSFVQDRLHEEIEKSGNDSEISDFLEGSASTLAAGVVERMTERKDFLLFSIYEIPMADKDYKYLGVCKLFIPLQEKQPLDL